MRMTALTTLQWYLEAGVDEAIADTPRNRLAPPQPVINQPPTTNHQPPTNHESRITNHEQATRHQAPGTSAAIAQARALAEATATREQLEAAVRAFDGLAIKKTATNTVFCDGNPQAQLMLIGEAPGASEDREGIPFCGPSGKLLDRMMAAIGYDRSSFYITNTLFWRPPGNRQPSEEELAICRPFVEKHIALINPKLLVLVGGTATRGVLQKPTGITRLRDTTHQYTNPYLPGPISTVAIFHPSYLLRSPAQKRLAWKDLLNIKEIMNKSH